MIPLTTRPRLDTIVQRSEIGRTTILYVFALCDDVTYSRIAYDPTQSLDPYGDEVGDIELGHGDSTHKLSSCVSTSFTTLKDDLFVRRRLDHVVERDLCQSRVCE